MRILPLDCSLLDMVSAGLSATRVATASGYTYIGWSVNDNPAAAVAEWCICRVDAAGNRAFADGTRDPVKVWNNRATYTYFN